VRICSLALVVVEILLFTKESCKTFPEPKLPLGSKNWQLIYLYYFKKIVANAKFSSLKLLIYEPIIYVP